MANTEPWVLGISASLHNGSACLLKGDRIVAAIQEERLSGIKRSALRGSKSSLAIDYCLDYAGIRPEELDLIVICPMMSARSHLDDLSQNPTLGILQNRIPTLVLSHHRAHAIAGFATSGFDEAAVLVVDGMGSSFFDLPLEERRLVHESVENGHEAVSMYAASGTDLKVLEKHLVTDGAWVEGMQPSPLTFELIQRFPEGMPRFGSLGGMYSAVARQVFGDPLDGAGKIMGLAPYGKPTIAPEEFFEVVDGTFVFKDDVPKRFPHDKRFPECREEYQDLAASVQGAIEVAIDGLVERLAESTGSKNLVYNGGVTLNSVANERIVRSGKFDQYFFFPPAEDSGNSVGAAYYGLWRLTGENTRRRLVHDAFGRGYDASEIDAAVAAVPCVEELPATDTFERAAELLADGKIIGWFSGRSELGPRSLGQRSILCDPRRADGKDTLNSRVKFREAFRPFAPSILLEEVDDWFEVGGESPFMLRVMKFHAEARERAPSVVHVDGTGRVQTTTAEANGPYYQVIKRFHEKTGVPIVLNTSFNVKGEPIIESPVDALWCFLFTGIDYVVFEDRIVRKVDSFNSPLDLVPRIREDADPTALVQLGYHLPRPLTRNLKSLVDGARNGWQIIEELSDAHGFELEEGRAIRCLAVLRRARVLEFSAPAG